MKLIVNPHKIQLIQEETVNEKEINVSECEFVFADEITDDFVKEALFTLEGNTYKKIIVNNKCTFPQEVLVKEGTVELGVVAYLVQNEEELIRYNPTPVYFKTDLGSLKEAQNSEEPTPSEMEQYEQALQDGLALVNDKLDDIDAALSEVDNLDIDANKVDTTTTVTITKKNGAQESVQIQDGTNGIDGVDGYSPTAIITQNTDSATISITDKNGTTTATIHDGQTGASGRDGINGKSLEFNWNNTQLGVRQEGQQEYQYQDLKGDTGSYTAGNNITISNGTISTSALNQTEVEALIADLGFTPTVVQTLPTQDIDTHTIYLVPKEDEETDDVYDEWLYINNDWEHIGSTSVDLSNYYTKSEVDGLEIQGLRSISGNNGNTKNHYYVVKSTAINFDSVLKPTILKIMNDYIKHYDTNYTYNHIIIDFKPMSGKFATIHLENWYNYAMMPDGLSTDIYPDYSTRTMFRFTYTDGVCTNFTAYQSQGPTPLTYAPLLKDNTYAYTPAGDYNPATKKYVDDSISTQIGNINTILATLTTPQGGE